MRNESCPALGGFPYFIPYPKCGSVYIYLFFSSVQVDSNTSLMLQDKITFTLYNPVYHDRPHKLRVKYWSPKSSSRNKTIKQNQWLVVREIISLESNSTSNLLLGKRFKWSTTSSLPCQVQLTDDCLWGTIGARELINLQNRSCCRSFPIQLKES